jgi:hypothetical protein
MTRKELTKKLKDPNVPIAEKKKLQDEYNREKRRARNIQDPR